MAEDKQNQTNQSKDNRQRLLPNKASVYEEFILWSAMPPMEQRRLGIETQEQFGEYYKVSGVTMWKWKQRTEFHQRRMKLVRDWAHDRTPGVIQSIYASCLKGNSDSQRIWLKYFEGWVEETKVDHTLKVEITQNDIRHLIEALPEKEKLECYGHLRQILDIATAVRNSGRLNDSTAGYNDAEDAVFTEADNDAQDVSGSGANELAESYPHSIRADLGDNSNRTAPASTYHNQSAERWW